MADLNVTLILDDSEYTGRLNAASAQIEKFGKQSDQASSQAVGGFGRMTTAAEALQRKMESFTTVLLGAGFMEIAHQSLELADTISDLSASTDVSIPKILQLREAFEANGGSADRLYRIINRLSESLFDAREGSAVAQENLIKLGFTFKEMANLNTEEAMGKVIDKLAEMSDVTERQALAFRVFGKDAMKIDWKGVAEGTKSGTDEFVRFTAAIEKAGQANDKLHAAAEKLLIAFTNLLDIVGVTDAINGASDEMAKFEKIVAIAGAAIVAYFGAKSVIMMVEFAGAVMKIGDAVVALGVAMNVLEKGTALGRILSLVTVLGAAGAAYLGWDKLQETIDENDKKRTEEAKKRAEELANAKGKGGDKPGVAPAWAKEIEQINQLSEAYKKTNDEALQKINTDRIQLGLGEDQKQMLTELNTLTRNYNTQIVDLTNRIKQEEQTPQSAARDARIGQLKREREEVTALYDEYLVKVPAAIKAQQAQASAIRDANYSWQLVLDTNKQLQLIQDQIVKTTMTETEKKYYDITIAAKASAQARIDAENKLLGFDDNGKKLTITAEKEKQIRDEAMRSATQLYDQLDVSIKASQDFGNAWNTSMRQYVEDTQNGAAAAQKIFSKLTSGLEDAFISFVKTGKLSFKDLVNSMLEEMVRLQFRQAMGKLMGSGSSGGLLGSLLGFANGGTVAANKPILVGENGPEMFVPPGNGTIVPNNQMGGASSVNYYINAVDAPSFKALVAQDPTFIHAVAMAGSKAYAR